MTPETVLFLLPELLLIAVAVAIYMGGAFVETERGWNVAALLGIVAAACAVAVRLGPCFRRISRFSGPFRPFHPLAGPRFGGVVYLIEFQAASFGRHAGDVRLDAVGRRRRDAYRRGGGFGADFRESGTGFDPHLHPALSRPPRRAAARVGRQVFLFERAVFRAAAVRFQFSLRRGGFDRRASDPRSSRPKQAPARVRRVRQTGGRAHFYRLELPHNGRALPFLRPRRLSRHHARQRRAAFGDSQACGPGDSRAHRVVGDAGRRACRPVGGGGAGRAFDDVGQRAGAVAGQLAAADGLFLDRPCRIPARRAGGGAGDAQRPARRWDGVGAIVFYLCVYAAATIGTFALFEYLGRRGGRLEGIDELAGLGREKPAAAAMLAVFMFSLTGIPILAGFWGKFQIFGSALFVDSGGLRPWFIALAVLGVLNAAVSAAYYLRIVAVMYFRSPLGKPRAEGGAGALLAAALCCMLTLGLGLYPRPLIDESNRARPQLEISSPDAGQVSNLSRSK